MTQDAVVTKVFPNGMAEVAVTRGTACGSNCGNCESCVFQSELKAFAKNSVNARPGEKVIIETLSSRIFAATLIVYIFPLAMLLVGYLVAASIGLGEGMSILLCFCFFAVAVAGVVIYQRRSKKNNPIKFEITGLR